MAEAGQARFAHPGLAFESDLGAAARQEFDLVHASGALQYVPSARATWQRLIAIPPPRPVPQPPAADRRNWRRVRRPVRSVAGREPVAYPSVVLGREGWQALVSETHAVRWEWEVAADREWAGAFPDLNYRGWLVTPRV